MPQALAAHSTRHFLRHTLFTYSSSFRWLIRHLLQTKTSSPGNCETDVSPNARLKTATKAPVSTQTPRPAAVTA